MLAREGGEVIKKRVLVAITKSFLTSLLPPPHSQLSLTPPPTHTLASLTLEHFSFFSQDYIFSLLTGYFDPPAGTPELGEGMAYNPYFPGGAIGMPQQLYPDGVEYDDGEKW